MATQVSLNSGIIASAGALAIQTNGTTEAVNISTGQVATLAQNPVLTSGTINGVAYLNGTRVLTTGSALVFDGTNLGVGGTATALGTYRGAEFAGTTATTGGFLRMRTSDSSINSLDFTDSNGRAIFTTTNHPVRFGVNDTEVMRLTSTSLYTASTINVGIGTSNPSSPLTISKTGATAIEISSGATYPVNSYGAGTGATQFAIANTGGTSYFGNESSTAGTSFTGTSAYATLLGTGAARSLQFVTNGAVQTTLDSSGNLLVGTTSSSLMGGKSLKIDGGTDTTGGQYSFLAYHSNSSYYFGLNNNGYVQASAIYGRTTASAANVNVDASGYVTRSTSARKYKQDIRDIEEMDISLLRPVRYKSKCESDDQNKDHLGVIADEAADAGFEELVTRGADGEVEGFQYERLTVVLLKKLQTQQALITQLTARITALESA